MALPRFSFFLSVFLSGCAVQETPPEVLRDVRVPGYGTPSRILYSRGDLQACRVIREQSAAVADQNQKSKAFLQGYREVQTQNSRAVFRIFYLPEYMEAAPYESAFILCNEGSTPIALFCSVMGTVPGGCFETGYAWYKLSEIRDLVKGIRQNAPVWSVIGGT
jgi:hypothetical protein